MAGTDLGFRAAQGMGSRFHARHLHLVWYLWWTREPASRYDEPVLSKVTYRLSVASRAVTFSLAVFRKFPWRRVPGYFAAQLCGAFAAACIIYGVYYGPLTALPGSFASVMTTGPADLVPSLASTFFSVFTGAALLSEWRLYRTRSRAELTCVIACLSAVGAICAFTDTGNNPATPGLTPLLLGLIMVGIASSFGYQTSVCRASP